MPIPKPEGAETEEKYISRCISEIASEYDAEGQAYAVCKGEFDKEKMTAQKLFVQELKKYVKYNSR